MSGPIVTCLVCGDREHVVPDGRGFPPKIARNRLKKRCKANGHNCDPHYRAGFIVGPPICGQSADETEGKQ